MTLQAGVAVVSDSWNRAWWNRCRTPTSAIGRTCSRASAFRSTTRSRISGKTEARATCRACARRPSWLPQQFHRHRRTSQWCDSWTVGAWFFLGRIFMRQTFSVADIVVVTRSSTVLTFFVRLLFLFSSNCVHEEFCKALRNDACMDEFCWCRMWNKMSAV